MTTQQTQADVAFNSLSNWELVSEVNTPISENSFWFVMRSWCENAKHMYQPIRAFELLETVHYIREESSNELICTVDEHLKGILITMMLSCLHRQIISLP